MGRAVEKEAGFMSYPDIHGDKIVFTYEGDLWLAGADGQSSTPYDSSRQQSARGIFRPMENGSPIPEAMMELPDIMSFPQRVANPSA